MEDGARTLRKQKAAYVGTQEWVRKRTKRGGTAGISEYLSRQSDDCRAVFLTERFGAFYVLLLFELALSAERRNRIFTMSFQKAAAGR